MAPRGKYAPDISWQDCADYIRHEALDQGVSARVELGVSLTGSPPSFCEVILYQVGEDHHRNPLVTLRYAFPETGVSKQWSNVMRAIQEAYMELDRNSWLWTPARRKRARGE